MALDRHPRHGIQNWMQSYIDMVSTSVRQSMHYTLELEINKDYCGGIC
jgi:hypothetical protein